MARISGTPLKSVFTSRLLKSEGNHTIAEIASCVELEGSEEEKESISRKGSSLTQIKRYRIETLHRDRSANGNR